MRTDVKITDEMIESIKNDLKEKEQRESEILSKGYIDWLVDYIYLKVIIILFLMKIFFIKSQVKIEIEVWSCHGYFLC